MKSSVATFNEESWLTGVEIKWYCDWNRQRAAKSWKNIVRETGRYQYTQRGEDIGHYLCKVHEPNPHGAIMTPYFTDKDHELIHT